MFKQLIQFIRDQYQTKDGIPLHAPVFLGNEKKYLTSTIESTFVSSVGKYVDQFESSIAHYVGCEKAVATVNGTAALHIAVLLAGVRPGDLVLTQPLTFVATCNAIKYAGADPVFIDVDTHTLGFSPHAAAEWLNDNARLDQDGLCRTLRGNQVIRACVPMHTFGHPVELDQTVDLCKEWNIKLVEDAAESLGSLYKNKHTGTFGLLGTLSFNGNKIITTGGGGMLITNQEQGLQAKHLTTTAKLPHPYEYTHDEIGYNYRLPNLNAALGCAQLEQLESYVKAKRLLAQRYNEKLSSLGLQFFTEPPNCRSNYWLNTVICENRQKRDAMLQATNEQGVMTRPIWKLMSQLPMYSHCLQGPLTNAEWLEDRVVNIPSSVLPEFL